MSRELCNREDVLFPGQISDDEDDDEMHCNPTTGSQNDKSNPDSVVKSLKKGVPFPFTFCFFVANMVLFR